MPAVAAAHRHPASAAGPAATRRSMLLPRSLLLIAAALSSAAPLPAQPLPSPAGSAVEPSPTESEATVAAPREVTVTPEATDAQIASRLQRILEATGRYHDPRVRVDSGVVFLEGVAGQAAHREWAERLAEKTQDVVAVVNTMTVAEQPFWNLTPAWEALEQLARDTIGALPLILVGLLVAVAAYWLARLAMLIAGGVARRRMKNQLLQQVLASVVGVIVFLLGLYIALKVSGLTRLAVTVLGGTGLVGLALGFAFRDIAENYLASILISLHHPFRVGDLILVDGVRGFVRRVTTRGTILVTIDGDHVQIPNSTVYKNTVTNFSASPASRLEFRVGIGFDASILQAQHLAIEALRRHPATLADPEPLVLVDALGSATVNLVCYLWYDRQQFLDIKVKSAAIRQVKQALSEAGISLPDEAREILFPAGVPVRLLNDANGDDTDNRDANRSGRSSPRSAAGDRPGRASQSPLPTAPTGLPLGPSSADQPHASDGEGNLTNDTDRVTRRADAHDLPDHQINLLE